jgi:molybdate transport system substrate-binding protein
LRAQAVGIGLALALAAWPTFAAQTNVAVAANFTGAAKEIAAAFKAKTGHDAVLSFGSSGQFYTQISQDAPFQVFLSADEDRPKRAVDDGFAVPESRFTYAIGKLVLWSKNPNLVKGKDTLKSEIFSKLAIANPTNNCPIWRRRHRDAQIPEPLRNSETQDRRGQQYRSGLPIY